MRGTGVTGIIEENSPRCNQIIALELQGPVVESVSVGKDAEPYAPAGAVPANDIAIRLRECMLGFLQRQWFLISLTTVFILGFCFPEFFRPFAEAKQLRNLIVAAVLFLMALSLDTNSITESIRRPWPAMLASAVNVILLPLVAWIFAQVLTGDMKTGMLVTAAVPCTLASAAVWTRRAGGDDTVSILVTTITNITCFLTVPFWLFVTTGSTMSETDQAELMRMPLRLGTLMVLPMVLAQVFRMNRGVATWATEKKPLLGKFTQVGILSMVLAGATYCGLKMAETNDWSNLTGVPLMCLIAAAIHLVVFFFGFRLARLCGFARPQTIAVGIAGSQKTLMVGLDIAISYFGGLAILPMVAYHFIQLTVDTMIADQLRTGSE